MELTELIRGAQDAMDRGDYRLAIAANSHAIKRYASCLAAHRMLGEAYLERADQQSAVIHFEKTLSVDPLNVVARLGLGVAAEETRDLPSAYAHYLHAWELNPSLDQVRDELVRLRGLMNVDDRLHPTRAGLAGIHARSGQYSRAAAEWRAVLAVEPDSRRGRTSLAELLWRQGDDTGAAAAARDALRGSPENARAIAILADIERRRGSSNADEYVKRFATVDPTADVVDVLQPWRTDLDLSFLRSAGLEIESFDLAANASRDTGPLGVRKNATASLATSQVQAPDLWDTLVQDLSAEIPNTNFAPTLASGVEPFNPSRGEAPTEPDTLATVVSASAESFAKIEMASADPSAEITNGQAGSSDSEETVPAPEAVDFETVVEVEVPENLGIELDADEMAAFNDLVLAMSDDAEQASELVAVVQSETGNAAHATGSPGSISSIQTPDYDTTVPFASDALMGTVNPSYGAPDESSMSAAFGDVSASVPDQTAEAGTSADHPASENADYVEQFVTADGKIDLTRGWDDLDQQLEAATPGANADAAFDDLLAELNVDGILPFDAETESPDEDAWAPFSESDFGAPATTEAVETAVPDLAQVAALPDAAGDTLDFADLVALEVTELAPIEAEPELGSEIVAGIPAAQASGYTELFRNVDGETPFESTEDDEPDPFLSPDASGEPLQFDELLEVTSSDGTGPLIAAESADMVGNSLEFADTDLEAALPPIEGDAIGLEFEGIEPFDSENFGSASGEDMPTPFDFADELNQSVSSLELVQSTEDVASFDTEIGELVPFTFDDQPDDTVEEVQFDYSDVANDVIMTGVSESFESDVNDVISIQDPVTYTSVLASSEPFADAEEPTAVTQSEDLSAGNDQPGWAGREGLGHVARKVLWPQFVNQTSALIDRALETENLFERIAVEKHALIEMGVITVDRRLEPLAVEAPVPTLVEVVAPIERSSVPEMSEQTRLDLMAMRIRLIEDEDAAPEIVTTLEKAMSEGLSAPLVLRVLGEAYLKLGQVERAAAQFRQAMLARRRSA